MHRQGEILRDLAALVDAGKIQHTMHQPAGIVSTNSLAAAHGLIESGKALGKIVLTMASSE
jgi:NADPH:quinone reductase-like Zn-dependent oxidoreductase